ncbi:MAG: formylglycine-generating enzyme family protein [Anaerolineales bacterium]
MSIAWNLVLRNILWMTLLSLCTAGCGSHTPPPTVTPVHPTPTETPSPPTATPELGEARVDEKGIEQVWVSPGSFQMGTDGESVEALTELDPPAWVKAEFSIEQPQHEVRITRGYWIDKYEVTKEAFRAFNDEHGYTIRAYWSEEGWKWLQKQPAGELPKDCGEDAGDYPMACVTWYEAEAYARWRGGRLPTEAEWEYAARGPESRVYPWGDAFDPALCNLVDAGGTMPVGSFPAGASWAGALDMAGNVMEWVQDWLARYEPEPAQDPTGPETGKVKVEKGGWWGAPFFTARSAYRHFEDPPTYQDAHIGFRIVSPM